MSKPISKTVPGFSIMFAVGPRGADLVSFTNLGYYSFRITFLWFAFWAVTRDLDCFIIDLADTAGLLDERPKQ